MKMTKEEAFKMLQGKKVYVGKFTKEVQEKLFEIGFWWLGSGKKVEDHRFIITYNNCTLQTCGYDYFVNRKEEEITISQILGIELEDEFKDGDILHSDWGGENINFILKNSLTVGGFYFYYASMSNTLGLIFDNNCWPKDVTVRYATKEECDKLLNAIDKQGYKWNSEEKKLENKLWRAEYNGFYYIISDDLSVNLIQEENDSSDNIYYDIKNYFKTKDEAQQYADKIEDLLKNR